MCSNLEVVVAIYGGSPAVGKADSAASETDGRHSLITTCTPPFQLKRKCVYTSVASSTCLGIASHEASTWNTIMTYMMMTPEWYKHLLT